MGSFHVELNDILQIEDPERFISEVRKLKKDDEPTNSPLLVAAKYGCHKILKSIVAMDKKMTDAPYNILLHECNDDGENVLHLGITTFYNFKIEIVHSFENIVNINFGVI